MENVRGRFDFDNGKVAMNDVTFLFHDAPVQFDSGDVVVEDSGRFALNATDLWVREIHFDSNMRKIMPPLMAQFALRLDDGKPFTAGETCTSAGRVSSVSRPGAAGTTRWSS